MQKLFAKKELIVTVYQERSFSKAAQKLFISQPSLSAMIRQIEEEVGLPLIDRSCKPIRMTEAGMAYIRAAEEIQRTEQSFINYICDINDLQAGTLSIGSNQLFSSLVLPRFVASFVSQYPRIQLDLVDANSAELESKLTDGQLDMIIDNKELDDIHFERRTICQEHLLLAVPANFSMDPGVLPYQMTLQDVLENRHMEQEIPAVPLEFFRDIPFILMTRDNDTRIRTDAIFDSGGLKPRILLEIDRLVTLYNFISQGTAAAVVSDTLIQNMEHPSDDIHFYKLGSPWASRGVYIHCKRNRHRTKAMEIFENLLCAAEP